MKERLLGAREASTSTRWLEAGGGGTTRTDAGKRSCLPYDWLGARSGNACEVDAFAVLLAKQVSPVALDLIYDASTKFM